jgi:4-amino-4-deoxy-L-arabinose transferase-like glycosyltransferase
MLPILLLAAADRFVNLPNRFAWDTDQGTEVGAIWNAVVTRQLPTFGSPAFTTGGTFHHGALFYDLMIPAAWLGNGNPTFIAAEIALFGFAVVPLVWWTARSIGGTSAGLATAFLAAVSPSLIDYSTLIWNPVLVEIGVALATLGAWLAWTTRRPAWWVVAAAGTALASQSHLTGLVLIFPMVIFFLVALRACPSGERRRLLGWGLASVGVFLLTWMPWIVSELTHNFAETRAILAFTQPSPPAADPLTRFLFSSIRMLAWPMTHWPLDNFVPGFPEAFAITVGLVSGLIWRVTGTLAGGRVRAGADAGAGGASDPAEKNAARREHEGLLFVGGSLLLIASVLGLGIKEISQVANINQEQYHVVADVFVFLAAGLVISGLWRATPLRGRPWSGHFLAGLAMVALVTAGIGHWPPFTSPDGGWPAAQAASLRLERDAGGADFALVALPAFKSADAYGYALTLDKVTLLAPDSAPMLVVLCDTGWFHGCGGSAEPAWIASNLPGRKLTLIDRFEPSPHGILSVYRGSP